MATETEHRLAQARTALQRALANGCDVHVLALLEQAYIQAVVDNADACTAVDSPGEP